MKICFCATRIVVCRTLNATYICDELTKLNNNDLQSKLWMYYISTAQVLAKILNFVFQNFFISFRMYNNNII